VWIAVAHAQVLNKIVDSNPPFYEYNTVTNMKRRLSLMAQQEWYYGMTSIVNSDNSTYVLVCGGRSSDVNFLSACALYDIAVNAWLKFPSMPDMMRPFSMIALAGRAFVFGGTNVEKKL
jgi:hypothetical protein